MKLNFKNYFWIIPLAAAFLFLLNIFMQESSNIFRLNSKQISCPLISKNSNKTPKQADITSNEFPKEKESEYFPFELRGTIVGAPCLAFIYNLHTNKQNVYKINDSIEDYKIIAIASAKIKIERKGITKELLLAAKNRKQEDNLKALLYAETDGTMVISRAGIRKKVIPAANELLAKIKILPMTIASSNKLKGFRIEHVPDGSIIESAGIKNGDIIHSIEGRQLTSMREAWHMFDQIKTQPRFEVVVLRGEKPVTLRYKMGD